MQENNYLKTSIRQMNNFISNHTQPPEDLALEFVLELRVSNLIIPAKTENNNISFSHILGEKGEKILPLFTDLEEFSKYCDDLNPISNDFGYYADLIGDLNFNGIIINCESDEFFVDEKLIRKIPLFEEIPKDRGYDEFELRRLAENAGNDELLAFIRDDDNFNNYDELAELLKKSVLLNVIVSDNPLDELAEGIVKRTDAEGFNLATTNIGSNTYGVFFTGLDAIKCTADRSMGHLYYQVSNLYDLFRFILSGDMDGAIINPGLEEYYISRNFILKITDSRMIINSELTKAIDYAFRI